MNWNDVYPLGNRSCSVSVVDENGNVLMGRYNEREPADETLPRQNRKSAIEASPVQSLPGSVAVGIAQQRARGDGC